MKKRVMIRDFNIFIFTSVFIISTNLFAATDINSTSRAVMSEDESIYVLQKRHYSKRGLFEVTPFILTAVNPKFVGYFGSGVSTALHIRENFAIELSASLPYLMAPFYSALVTDVYNYESLTPESVDLKRMTWFGGVTAQYSSFYGKADIYGMLIDYDFYLLAGFGLVTTEQTCTPNKEDCSERVQGVGVGLRQPVEFGDWMKLSGNLGGGLRFFFSNNLGLRLEFRDIVYADRDPQPGLITTDIRNTIFFFAGLSFVF